MTNEYVSLKRVSNLFQEQNRNMVSLVHPRSFNLICVKCNYTLGRKNETKNKSSTYNLSLKYLKIISEEICFKVKMIKRMDKILKSPDFDEIESNVLGAQATDAESMLSILQD
jgi:hypothetical protein